MEALYRNNFPYWWLCNKSVLMTKGLHSCSFLSSWDCNLCKLSAHITHCKDVLTLCTREMNNILSNFTEIIYQTVMHTLLISSNFLENQLHISKYHNKLLLIFNAAHVFHHPTYLLSVLKGTRMYYALGFRSGHQYIWLQTLGTFHTM